MSWWSERKERKARKARWVADPELRQLCERHASSTMVHLHPEMGIMKQSGPNIVWSVDGGTTVFINRNEWYELMSRVQGVWGAAPSYVDIGEVP